MNTEDIISSILEDFSPISIGDPIGEFGPSSMHIDDGVRYFPLDTWWHWGIIAFFVFAIGASIYNFKYRKNRGTIRRILSVIIWTILPAAFIAGLGFASSYYWGGPYAYDNYRVPSEASDVMIWFSGSDDGAYFQDNYYRCNKQYPPSSANPEFRAALFNFKDIDKAIDFVKKLPQGCRVVVRGHSMGGSAAMRFAQKCGYPIELLDTRDPTSWFGKRPRKPANVKYWRNVLPGEPDWKIPKEEHYGTNYWGKINMANVFRSMGGAWDKCPDATNVVMPNMDHHEVGENLE